MLVGFALGVSAFAISEFQTRPPQMDIPAVPIPSDSGQSFAWKSECSAVLSAVIMDMYVRDETALLVVVNNGLRVKQMVMLGKETEPRVGVELTPDEVADLDLKVPFKIRWLSNQDLDSLFSKDLHDGWRGFYRMYP